MGRVHRHSRHRGYRRTKITAAAVLCAVGATTFVGTGTGQAAPTAPRQAVTTPGQANALAQILKVNPRAGSLSVGITNGISLADYQNNVARAESRAVDLGIIGTLLAADSCTGGAPTLSADKQPQSVRAEARGAPQSTGEVPEDKVGGLMVKFAEATPQPFGHAWTTTAAQEIIPGILSIGAGRSETTTQFVDGVRVATAVTELAGLTVGTGPVKIELTGLRWEAIHRSDGPPTGTFSIGGASRTLLGGVVDGIPILGPALGQALEPIVETLPLDPAVLIDTISQVLAPLGVSIVMPTSFEASGIQFVDPLKVGFIPSELRDGIVQAVLGGIQPVREQIVTALFEADCRSEDIVTVADIAVGSLTGSGDFHLELGGVSASTRDFSATCFLCGGAGGLGGGSVNLPGLPSLGGTPSIAGTPGTPALPAAVPSTATEGTTTNRATRPTSTEGKRGGALALVSLIGLGLLGAVAEGDRRKMRKAQRLIPVEA